MAGRLPVGGCGEIRIAASLARKSGSHPHRHQDVEGAAVGNVHDHGRRGRIGERELRALALDLLGYIEEIASVEANLNSVGTVIRAKFLGCGAGFRIYHRKRHLVSIEVEFDRARLVGGDG